MSIPTHMKAIVYNEGKLEVRSEVPVPGIRSYEILVKTVAVGGNPTDWKSVHYKWGPNGSIVGTDVIGEIVRLGEDVNGNKFQKGDYAFGFIQGANYYRPDNGAFAEYVALDSRISFKAQNGIQLSGKDYLPEGAVITLESGASLPCSWFTAAGTLFQHMKLDMVWEPKTVQRNGSILLWGGATALGQIAIQLLKKLNAFEKIVVVASKKHEEQLKKYGADEVYDYHDADIIEQVKSSKYNNFTWLLDCVSNPETLNQVYQCAPKDTKSVVFNYLGMNINHIKSELKRDDGKVTIDGTVMYRGSGERVCLGDDTYLDAVPEYRDTLSRFIDFVTPYINNGELHNIPVKVYNGGFESIIQLVNDIQAGKNSGEKLVAIL